MQIDKISTKNRSNFFSVSAATARAWNLISATCLLVLTDYDFKYVLRISTGL